MSLVGLSVGYFSPQSEFGDVGAVCDRIREICGPCSSAFPFVRTAVKGPDGSVGAFYGVIAGHVPIHVTRPNAAESCPTMFTFVIEADERPVLLFAPAGQREAMCIFRPDDVKLATMGLGAVEMVDGRAFYFDLARAFYGVTSFPTGDLVLTLPAAVIVQVPWARADDIAGAIHRMKSVMRADERFADLIAQQASE